ncbi:MAG: ferritin-like domain-containing protein [Candidatus Cyclobacteriaceae bacterium M3_2C_046]
MARKFNNLRDLFEHEIKDLYSAESQLINALPKMAEAASNDQLEKGFTEHLEQTKTHKERLEKVAQICEFDPKGETCDAMEGLVEEGEEIIKSKAESAIKDAALIGAAQRVEHYEISAYGTAINYAEMLGYDEVVKILKETLEQEKETDAKLNHMAVDKINQKALSAE